MPDWNKARQHNAERIEQILKQFKLIRRVKVPENIQHAEYKHYCFVNIDQLANGWSRDRIVHEVVKLGVPCYQGSCSEVYLEKAFDSTGFRPKKRLLSAKLLGDTSLMFLVHPTLSPLEIDKTCEVLEIVLARATKSE